MAGEPLHVPREALPQEGRLLHYAITSLREELDTRAGVLILGQDLEAGYSSQDGVHYHLYVSESIVLRIDEPKAICVITAQG
jgi:hypothetical protein